VAINGKDEIRKGRGGGSGGGGGGRGRPGVAVGESPPTYYDLE